MPIYRPSHLHELGIRARKSLSQNFLIDQNILKKIGDAASINEGDLVYEVGPGPGAITEQLLSRGATVYAVEIDRELASRLDDASKSEPRLHVVCGDALDFSLDEIPLDDGQKLKVVANLPFQITAPLLDLLLRRSDAISSITIVIQKEVADRIVADRATSDYSHLSLFSQTFAKCTYCFTVKPGSFFPKPKVHCAVVQLIPRPFPFPFDEAPFFQMTKAAFSQKRKMLRASLKGIYGSSAVEEALESIGLSPTSRPQELSLEEFGSLFSQLSTAEENKDA